MKICNFRLGVISGSFVDERKWTLIESLGKMTGDYLLDIGSGGGHLINLMQEMFGNIVSVEIDRKSLLLQKTKFFSKRKNVDYALADANSLLGSREMPLT